MLLNFKLRHVSGKDHVIADGLSQRPHSPEDPEDEGNVEEWIDKANDFNMECLNTYRGDIWDKSDKPIGNTKIDENYSLHKGGKQKDLKYRPVWGSNTELRSYPDSKITQSQGKRRNKC